jgi:hypothetical protein
MAAGFEPAQETLTVDYGIAGLKPTLPSDQIDQAGWNKLEV